MGNYNQAKAYSLKHLNEGDIRKIQQYLKYSTNNAATLGRDAKEYYKGEIDGKFGPQTYAAIMQYQKDHGMKEDGMWGIKTNEYGRVLNRTGGKNEDSAGDKASMTGTRENASIFNQGVTNQRKYLQNIQERASVDPEWFGGDSEDAVSARGYLNGLTNNGKNVGQDMIRDIYENWTPEDMRSSISLNKLPVDIQSQRYNSGITEATNDAAKKTAAVGAGIAGSLLAAEAIPLAIEYAPQIGNAVRSYGQFLKSAPEQMARMGYEQVGPRNLTNWASQGVNPSHLFGGTRLGSAAQAAFENGAATNLGVMNPFRPMWMPVGFRNGGKIESIFTKKK